MVRFIGEFFLGALIASFVVFVFETYRFVGALFDGMTGFSSSQAPEVLDGDGRDGVVTRLAMVVTGLVFLSFDGHHIVIRAVAASFRLVRPGEVSSIDGSGVAQTLVLAGSGAFATALACALPGIFFLLLFDFTTAVVGRAFPELQTVATDPGLRRLTGLVIVAVVLLIATPPLNGFIEATFFGLGLSGQG